jgi:hypothetical protein
MADADYRRMEVESEREWEMQSSRTELGCNNLCSCT